MIALLISAAFMSQANAAKTAMRADPGRWTSQEIADWQEMERMEQAYLQETTTQSINALNQAKGAFSDYYEGKITLPQLRRAYTAVRQTNRLPLQEYRALDQVMVDAASQDGQAAARAAQAYRAAQAAQDAGLLRNGVARRVPSSPASSPARAPARLVPNASPQAGGRIVANGAAQSTAEGEAVADAAGCSTVDELLAATEVGLEAAAEYGWVLLL